MSIQNVHETDFCKWQIDLLQSYITFIPPRLFSKFKITTVVRIDNKTLDKLIETWQLIFLKIIFNVSTKPINYMRSYYLNTLVVCNMGVLKYPLPPWHTSVYGCCNILPPGVLKHFKSKIHKDFELYQVFMYNFLY